ITSLAPSHKIQSPVHSSNERSRAAAKSSAHSISCTRAPRSSAIWRDLSREPRSTTTISSQNDAAESRARPIVRASSLVIMASERRTDIVQLLGKERATHAGAVLDGEQVRLDVGDLVLFLPR